MRKFNGRHHVGWHSTDPWLLVEAADRGCERLEDRVHLAGDVRAVLSSAGHLRIIGTPLDNQVVITSDAFGNITVSGLPGTGTTVNGATVTTFFETGGSHISGNLTCVMKGGSDYVEIDGIYVERDVRINMAAGEDTVGIFDTFVMDDLTIIGGTGGEVIGMSRSNIGDRLRIVGGGGEDLIGIASCVMVGGYTSLIGGGETDLILIQGNYGDRVNVVMGAGNDAVYTSQVAIVRDLRVNLGTGDDGILEGNHMSVAQNGTLIGGAGNDTQIFVPFVGYFPLVRTVEVSLMDPTANDDINTMAVVISVVYVSRGGDPADIPC
ncbi:MAG: hypothetical protein KDA60_21590 [Planctomycetales bacterium]|nr:hypothetical protein [Planctomycetales bacterium]